VAGIVGADLANWRGVFEINVFAPIALIGAFGAGMSAPAGVSSST